MKRRDFLKHAIAAGSVLAIPRFGIDGAPRRAAGGRTLVVVFLNGGNDGLNTVIPYRDPMYARLRPGLAIPRSQVRTIHGSFGLHPALNGFEELWRRERLAIVNGVGYPRPNYSHFRSTEIWFSGEPDRSPSDGWLGRAIDARPSTKPLRAIALGREKPLSLQAASPGIATLTEFSRFKVPPELERVAKLYSGAGAGVGPLAEVGRAGAEAMNVARKIAALKPAEGGFYGRLGTDLRKALALLQSDIELEVIQMSFGGFDTHASQAGAHQGLLAAVGNNLRAFQDRLEASGLAERVLTFVFSEFGRRPAENLSGGTDHGSAGPAFLIGKGVRPGLHGAYPSLEDLDAGNFRFTTDFRSVHAGIAKGFLGLDPKPVAGAHEPLELLA